VNAPDRLVPIAPRLHALVKTREVAPEILPIRVLRHTIDADRRVLAGSPVGSLEGRHIDEMGQRMEPPFGLVSRSFHYLPQLR
jgi:hypothetical protein